MSGGGTGRASPLFIHSIEAILYNVPVDNGRKDKPQRGSACNRAYGARAAHLQSFRSRQVVFYRYVSLFMLASFLLMPDQSKVTGCTIIKGRAMAPFGS